MISKSSSVNTSPCAAIHGGLDARASKPHIGDMPLTRKRKRPRDPNQLGKMIVDISVGEVEDRGPTAEEEGKDAAAVSLGRRGGLRGGVARAKSLTPEQRAEIARLAAAARWKKKK